jgi:hypothetical protein
VGKLSSKLIRIEFGLTNAVIGAIPALYRGDHVLPGGGIPPQNANGDFICTNVDLVSPKVWNAVWNDIADFQLLCDELIHGKCYFDTKDGARICHERCQMSVIGIASDTFGFGVGSGAQAKQVPIAVAGWVLAYVDKEYECGTPLTNDENGNLTAITKTEKMEYPERIVALYKRMEMDEFWGPTNQQIKVNGRHWVKVK